MAHPSAFRLLDLPAELRLRIYEHALAPTGVLHVASTKANPRMVRPAVTPQLLASCRQIQREAHGILVEQNEICVTVDAHDTCEPTVPPSRLAPAALEKLQHFCVVLDCANYFNASYADVNWAPFEALVSLKTIRIAMVYRKQYPSQRMASLHIATLREFNAIAQILERVPADAEVRYGTVDGSQQHEVVWQVITARARGIGGKMAEATAEDLKAAGNGLKDLVRGSKSRAERGSLCKGAGDRS